MASSKGAHKHIRFPLSAKRGRRRAQRPRSRQLDLFREEKTVQLPLGGSPLDVAVLYDDCGDWEAVEWYERAIACSDRSVEALCGLGDFYARNLKWKMALACFEDAVARDPFSFDVHLCLGDYFVNIGNDEGAVKHYRWALRIDPSNVLLRVAMGFVLARLDRKKEAIVELEASRGIGHRHQRRAAALLEELKGCLRTSDPE